MTYPGGKNGEGVYQRIICEMPPHSLYVEPFVGSGAILRRKRPAARSIALDLDQTALDALDGAVPRLSLLRRDGIEYLQTATLPTDALVYCDPPYVLETRSKKRIYRHEMTDQDHARLLDALLALPCYWLLSGYRCKLYEDRLAGVRALDYPVQTRGGRRTETLWASFTEPNVLHDYRYLGTDYRERERIRRKRTRWLRRFRDMPRLERLAMLGALADSADPASPTTASLEDRHNQR